MANRYVRSTDGSDADNGTTWALAKATLTGVAAIDAAGDVIWVSQVHAESTAAAISFNWAGTVASPTRVLCGNDAAEPPTALATTGTVTTTGNSTIDIGTSGFLYIYGLTFNSGSGASGAAHINLNSIAGIQKYDSCNFHLATTGATSRIAISEISGANAILENCGFQFSSASQGFTCNLGRVIIRGGSILADTSPTQLFKVLGADTDILMEGCDLTNGAATMNFTDSNVSGVRLIVRNCKLPASWSGSINSVTPVGGSIFELFNSDSADTNYRLQRKTPFGEVTHETTVVKTGGASDGTTALSWKMVSNSGAEWNHQSLDSPEIVKWNETTGGSITVTVDVLHDGAQGGSPSVPLTDRDIWLEVQYLGTDGFPLSLFATDAASSGSPYESNYLATEIQQENSSATWTTTGMSNPLTQKLSVVITPREKGFIHGVVKMAKASYTAYIDPVLQVS